MGKSTIPLMSGGWKVHWDYCHTVFLLLNCCGGLQETHSD